MPTFFGQFELNEETRELLLRHQRVVLQPRVFDVLAYLVRHRNRMVGKEELLNRVWPDVIVTDASLQRAISLIRVALRTGGCAEAVQTRARLGYRFYMEGSTAATEPAPPGLLERDSFLEELSGRFRSAQEGTGQAVFVSGEAGIGKSALLTAFLAGRAKEITVLRGYCDALFTPRAFGAILDIARQLPDATARSEGELGREQLFARLYGRLQALDSGTIVVLEDLHWADEATLDFVRFIARRISSTRCLLLATYRDEERGANRLLSQALGDLASPHVTRQRLLPLTVAAVQLLAREAGQEKPHLFNLTGGNPFLTRELLSSPLDEVPKTVRDSMLARLARCSESARKVCEMVALLPGRAELDLVARILGGVGKAVDEAVDRGLILHEQNALAYRHELARLAVENLLPPAQSRTLHAQILAGLREQRGDIARLVHHARCAGDRAAVLELAPEAARRAASVGAHREAAAHYATALAFADELPVTIRVQLFEKHAYESYLTSQIAIAVESATSALVLWRKLGERHAEGRTLRFLSRQYWFLGDRSKAEQFAADAIIVLAALPPSRDLAMAYSNRSQLEMLQGQVAPAVESGEKAVVLARALADVEVESHALNNIGSARLNAGDLAGVAELERSLQLALAHDLHEHVARAYANLSTGAMRQQKVSLARRHLLEGSGYCEERDLYAWIDYLRVYQARFDLDRGDWDRASKAVTPLLKGSTTTTITRIPALIVLAQVQLRRGLSGALAFLDEALALAMPTGELQRIGPVASARAEAAWLRHDWPVVTYEADRGLAWALPARDSWMVGELLFWKSRVASVGEVPPWVAEPYRSALRGDWQAAANDFAQHEMPYPQALMLAQGDHEAGILSHQLLVGFKAQDVIAALAWPGTESRISSEQQDRENLN